MNSRHDFRSSRGHELGRADSTTLATPEERLAWYRERDRDAADLHRRYVRAKFRIHDWSDADLARFHRYRRNVSRERAAQLVLARRYALIGLSAIAVAALVAGLLYAAFLWWRRRKPLRALPAPKAAAKRPEGRE